MKTKKFRRGGYRSGRSSNIQGRRPPMWLLRCPDERERMLARHLVPATNRAEAIRKILEKDNFQREDLNNIQWGTLAMMKEEAEEGARDHFGSVASAVARAIEKFAAKLDKGMLGPVPWLLEEV